MAEVKKPGRPKKLTAAQLEKGCEAYFASISYREEVIRKVPMTDQDGSLELDEKGHQKYRYEQIKTADGKPAYRTVWIEPPGIMALCLFLGIDATTFERYGKLTGDDPESERFCRTVTRARGRVEAYLAGQLDNSKAARGAIFNLQQNFGWKERREVDFGEDTRKAMGVQRMSMEEKLALLQSVADELPELE